MLPMTHYNQSEMMDAYRRGGEYGLSRLEAVVASGTKQRHLASKASLEEHLNLDEILKPLSSSHTQSGKEKEENPEKDDISISPEKDVENDSEEENERIEKEGN